MTTTKYQGKLTISRYTGGEKGSGITIRVTDELSGTEFIEIEITAEVLGNCITGLSYQPCEFELRAANVGKTHEHKTEIIPFTVKDYSKREAEARAAMKPYEVDGWKGSWSDMCNHHNSTKAGQRVTFHRYV